MLLIVNPKAGKGTIKKKIPKIIKNFEKKGYNIKTVYTKVKTKRENMFFSYRYQISNLWEFFITPEYEYYKYDRNRKFPEIDD